MSKALTISGSIFLVALSIGVLGYITNQASLWQLPEHMRQDERSAKQDSKPVKAHLSDVNTGGTKIGITTTDYRISNPSDRHIALCVRSVIVSKANNDAFYTPPYCFANIPPFTTMTQSVPNQDIDDRIGSICYDTVKYDGDLRHNTDTYNQQLSQWQAKVDDYTSKIPNDPIYAKAVKALNDKKPQLVLPEKVLDWNACETRIEDI